MHLIIIHGATQGAFGEAQWLHTCVGTPDQPGRVVTGLQEGTRLIQQGEKVQIWFGTGIDDRPTAEDAVPRTVAAARLLAEDESNGPDWYALVGEAIIDTQSPNTAMECKRAITWALSTGEHLTDVTVISTRGHLPRCLTDAMKACDELAPDVNVRALAAKTLFPALDDLPVTQYPAIFDWAHVRNAPFAQVNKSHQLNVLHPSIFGVFKGDAAKYTALTLDYVALLKSHGVTHNIDGEAI